MQSIEIALASVRRESLACLPTPLATLHNLGRLWNHEEIYIKRDDLTGLGPGGNKLRSLEFIAGEAIAQNADTLVAAGPLQSNLCTLTAATCAKLGLKCILIHNGERPEHPVGNLLLNRLLGAESIYLGNVTSKQREDALEEVIQRISLDRHPYAVRNGATTGCGALGYTNAILELKEQAEQRNLSNMTIFAPGGNGGVATGLIYGNALCGFPFKVVIISVEDSAPVLKENICRTIKEVESILHLPFPCPLEDACIIDDSYRGAGWGSNTELSSQAISAFAQAEGILIENIYNSKVLVGMQDYLRNDRVQGPVCYLHTGGFGSLFAQY